MVAKACVPRHELAAFLAATGQLACQLELKEDDAAGNHR